jgi:hypothetical protein
VSAQAPAFRKHARVPNPEGVRRTTLPGTTEDVGLERFLGDLAPNERKALDWIVENADLIRVREAAAPYLLVEASPWLLDTLAAFGAESEDRENDLEDEPSEDVELDTADDEPSLTTVEAFSLSAGLWSMASLTALSHPRARTNPPRLSGVGAFPRMPCGGSVSKSKSSVCSCGMLAATVPRFVRACSC